MSTEPIDSPSESSEARRKALSDGLRYDPSQARQSIRRGSKERGCWIYVPGLELRKAGFDTTAPAPRYRLWGRRSGSLLVRLYPHD